MESKKYEHKSLKNIANAQILEKQNTDDCLEQKPFIKNHLTSNWGNTATKIYGIWSGSPAYLYWTP